MNTEEENNRRMRIKSAAKTKDDGEKNKVREKARNASNMYLGAKRSKMKTKIEKNRDAE